MLRASIIEVKAIIAGSGSIPYSVPYTLRVALVNRLTISVRISITI